MEKKERLLNAVKEIKEFGDQLELSEDVGQHAASLAIIGMAEDLKALIEENCL